MRSFIILMLLIMSFLISACTDHKIVGHWRPFEKTIDSKDIDNKNGDLIIKADSTYQMIGDLVIPGLHIRPLVEGNWDMPDKDHLRLQVAAPEIKFALEFKILKCDGKELHLVSNMNPNDSLKVIRFKKL